MCRKVNWKLFCPSGVTCTSLVLVQVLQYVLTRKSTQIRPSFPIERFRTCGIFTKRRKNGKVGYNSVGKTVTKRPTIATRSLPDVCNCISINMMKKRIWNFFPWSTRNFSYDKEYLLVPGLAYDQYRILTSANQDLRSSIAPSPFSFLSPSQILTMDMLMTSLIQNGRLCADLMVEQLQLESKSLTYLL